MIFIHIVSAIRRKEFALKDDADHTPILFPYKAFKINKEKSSKVIGNQSFYSYTRFEIIDDKGFSYRFGENEDGCLGASFEPETGASNGWLMSAIESPTNHKVTFAYIPKGTKPQRMI